MEQDLILLEVLKQVNLKEKQAKVYLALLELGKGGAGDIAKLTELKRSIIYVVLENLINQGYVNEVLHQKIKTYQAIQPTVILQQLKKASKNLLEMLPVFKSLSNQGKYRPKIHYIENKKGILNIFEEMNWAKDALFITSYIRLQKHFPGLIKKWLKDFKKGNYKLKARHLIPKHPKNIETARKFKRANQQVKTLSKLKDVNMDFTIYDNKLAITSLEEKPFMVLIESESLVSSLKSLFEIIWQVANKL